MVRAGVGRGVGLSLSFMLSAASAAAQQPPTPERQRQELAEAHAEAFVQQQNVSEVVGVIDSGLCVLAVVVGVASIEENPAFGAVLAGGCGLQLGAVATALLISRDATDAVLAQSIYALPALPAASLAVERSSSADLRLSAVASAAGFFGTAVLEGVNIFSRSTAVSTVRAHAKRGRGGPQLSPGDLRRLEQDVLGTADAVPSSLVALPLALGSAVALAPAVSGASKRDQTWSLVLGGGGLLLAVGRSLRWEAARSYREWLARAGLELLAGPSGAAVRSTF